MLRIFGLKKAFRTGRVLRRLNVEIPAGRIVAISGPSGAGKSTLLHLIAGIDKPDEGRICWGTNEWTSDTAWVPPWRRSVSLAFQDFALWPHLTVRQHLDFVLRGRRGLGHAKRRSIQEKWLDLLQMGQLADRHPGELSGGQQQRVGLARALVREPELLLLDEPFSQLDPVLAHQVAREIAEWQDRVQATILVVSHASDHFAESVDLRFVLCDGRLEMTQFGLEIRSEGGSSACV